MLVSIVRFMLKQRLIVVVVAIALSTTASRDGRDLHLYVGYIRKSIYGEILRRKHAADA